MRYIIIIVCMLMMVVIVYAEEKHGPGWKSSHCGNIVDPDQAVICNMMGLETLMIDEFDWEVWEFDDSYIVLHEDEEVFHWDCILDNDTDKANLFFCEAIMGYDYDKIFKSFDLSSNSSSDTN